MGLDLGERRIGIAVSDDAGSLVLPVGHVDRSRRLKDDIEAVLNIAQERRVEGLVIGMPYHISGDVGVQAKRAQGFVRALRKRTELPVFTVDEGYTSVEAEALLREAGNQPSRNRGAVDALAAVLILRRFLDQQTAPGDAGA